MLLALFLVTLTMTTAEVSAENIAPPCAHVKQAVESHFQFGSGAGS